jgi:glycosyltransferase involved in cell wall biosynthesis
LPNKLFEYMMAGLAIVSTDLPEIRRVVMDHHVGLLILSIEPKEIARTLNGLLADRVALERMKRSALQAAQVVYNWEHEREGLLKLYESVVPMAEVA